MIGTDDRQRSARASTADTPRASPVMLTPPTTIEAMLYVLRRGLSCLDDPANRARLRLCDEPAMKDIVARLRTWKSHNVSWLPAWSDADIAMLAKAWRTPREGRA